ncbi:MAG: Gldg family protein [Clostridia bacterium]|nr:Gldg family protein [Clostridia bacterium]
MKKFSVNSRKIRYGGVTAALTALIIAIIIIVNVIFSMLSQKFTWYVDMTPDLLYTLSDESKALLRDGDSKFETTSPIEMVDSIREENKESNEANGLSEGDEGYLDEDIMINIIFCDDIDTLQSNSSQRYVYNTALELQTEFPDHINVINYNIIRNPSAVSKYKTTSSSTIATTSVIVEFGTEFRIYNIRSFFTFDTAESEEPWAYNGEKKFVSGILAVTRAESPIACFTTNHGETFLDYSLLETLVDAGYIVQELNLEEEEIPKDCRLMVVFNPVEDFLVNDGLSGSDIDEIVKLDAFLDETNSLMVFMSPDSPVDLPEFEGYLAEWGIKFNKETDENSIYPHMIKDSSQAITKDGYSIVGEYADYGLGGSVTEDMRSAGYPKRVIFPRAMSISYTFDPAHYVDEEDESEQFDYGSYYSNGVSRSIYDVFVTSENAVAHAGGEEIESATKNNPLKLMTLSVENRSTQESNYTSVDENSYVLACGSTQFSASTYLDSASYGNADVLLSACRAIGKEPVPVGLEPKPFADYDIDSITTAESTQYTVVLTVVPALIAIISGAIVLIRRKNR